MITQYALFFRSGKCISIPAAMVNGGCEKSSGDLPPFRRKETTLNDNINERIMMTGQSARAAGRPPLRYF